ncbi:phosphodiesterase [Vibrio sp.]|uniref:Phosphoesterase n=1 Tax=Vibrio viridaestus TaxID=2487322 RepID=A0A3N9TE73_9VIBR|nr:phosphodiesterase [Vibrio viridaestus]MDC0611610.1 phosphodiesterase [Vibrio sp.]RQW62511.1 phosphodiesterase [Vibrio viridaestus]
MKLLIASDIHGSLPAVEKVLAAYTALRADYLVLLGDLLNHGPRNSIPLGYDPASVAERLNYFSDRIVAVRGNCDSEVDQMLLEFPALSDFSWVLLESGHRLFLTHGHIYNPSNHPRLGETDILVHGHTHIPVAGKVNDVTVFNPGSPTFPKENHQPSFGFYSDGALEILDFDYQHLMGLELTN